MSSKEMRYGLPLEQEWFALILTVSKLTRTRPQKTWTGSSFLSRQWSPFPCSLVSYWSLWGCCILKMMVCRWATCKISLAEWDHQWKLQRKMVPFMHCIHMLLFAACRARPNMENSFLNPSVKDPLNPCRRRRWKIILRKSLAEKVMSEQTRDSTVFFFCLAFQVLNVSVERLVWLYSAFLVNARCKMSCPFLNWFVH